MRDTKLVFYHGACYYHSMTALTFDTLSTARRLREKGISQEHAEAIADEIRMGSSIDVSHLVTKDELKATESSINATIRELELRMTIRLGAMIMALGGVLIAVKFLN